MSEKRRGGGQKAAREIDREVEARTGHPTSGAEDEKTAQPKRSNEELADEFFGVSPRSHQHSRKGQAESPRELNPNQPERKHGKNR